MATSTSYTSGFRSLPSAMAEGAQWRLLLLWLLIMLIPATLTALPLWRMLSGLLDRSVHAQAWAQHFNDIMFSDVMANLSDHPQWIGSGLLMGLIVTLLLSPFLDGMVVASGRAGQPLRFGMLLQNGLIEYGRMFRMMLWSLVPYAVVAIVGVAMSHMLDHQADQAVLESQVDRYASMAHWVLLIVFVLMQAVVESARAAFIADISLRSATRALWRGIHQLVRRPLWTLLFYLIVTLVGLVLASLLGMARIHVTAFGASGFIFALFLSQLMVLAIGWMRTARLFALAKVARSL